MKRLCIHRLNREVNVRSSCIKRRSQSRGGLHCSKLCTEHPRGALRHYTLERMKHRDARATGHRPACEDAAFGELRRAEYERRSTLTLRFVCANSIFCCADRRYYQLVPFIIGGICTEL